MNVNEELHPYITYTRTPYKSQSPFFVQLPIQSMGLEYLPTFGVDFYGFHVGIIYNRPMDPMGLLHLFIGCPQLKKRLDKGLHLGFAQWVFVAETMGGLVKIHGTYC